MKKIISYLLPPRYHFKLVSLKHILTKFKQIHYSQNGEDIILNSLFPKKYKGFYVDVGAHHPYRISNTYLLYKNGWSGINIDANPETISLFKKARPKDTNLLIGVGAKEDTLTYHRFSDPAVNTFSDADAEKWKHKKWIYYLGTTQVPTKSLGKILDENLPLNTSIDVLSIDVEGLDLEVLQSNNWEKYRPKVVVVEDHTFSIEEKDRNTIYTFLKDRNYVLKNVVKFSLVFIRSTD